MIRNALQSHRVLRFLLIGLCNTAVGMGTMLMLYNIAGLSYWISSAGNYIVGSILSYALNKRFTFRSEESPKRAVPRFVLHILLCYLLAYGLAKQLALCLLAGSSLVLQDNVAMIVGSGVFMALNYLGQKRFVFPEKMDAKKP